MKTVATLAILLLTAPAAWAQDLPHARLDGVSVAPGEARAGDIVKITVTIGVDPDWHTYPTKKQESAAATIFTFEGGAEIAGTIEEPKTEHHVDKDLPEIQFDFIPGNATFVIPVRVPASLKPGPATIKGKVEGQVCSGTCDPYEFAISAPIKILEGKPDSTAKILNPQKVKVLSATTDRTAAKAGDVLKVTVRVEVEKNWHIYSVKPTDSTYNTRFAFEGAAVEGTIEEAPLKHHQDKDLPDLKYDYLDETATFVVPVKVAADIKEGSLAIKGTIEYQPCDPGLCLQPQQVAFTVVPGKPEPLPAAQGSGGAAEEAAKEFEKKGLGWLLGIAVLGGLVSLIMPCVYPLIPVTITYFVKQAGASRSTGMMLAGMYGLGIVITFTGIGFLLTILLGAAGAQIFASSPWVNLGIALMFGAFALSMFGLFEIALPSGLMNAVAGGGPKSGVFGAFILGCLFSIVSFTCTIPIAATILGIAASSGNRLAGLLGMLTYSGTMAVPFLFLGLFPSSIKELPKSGGWLHTVKVATGFLELALAVGYIWKADFTWGWGFFDRWIVLAIWIATSFLTSLYLLGIFRVKGDGEQKEIGFPRLVSAILFAIIGFYLVGGLMGRPVGVFNILLPPDEELSAGGGAAEHVKVYEDLEEAEAVAKKEGRPIFLEFTGYT